jgi:hypothetical protein
MVSFHLSNAACATALVLDGIGEHVSEFSAEILDGTFEVGSEVLSDMGLGDFSAR